jgi:integrase
MVELKLRGINKVRKRLADGSWRYHYYWRATGEKLRGEFGSDEFIRRWRELSAEPAEQPVPDARSVRVLITAYKSSPEFAQLAPKTRKDYGRYLDKLGALWGEQSALDIKREHVFALRDRFADKPRTANYMVQVLRLVLTYAVDRGWRSDNPASRPKLLRTGDGHRPWEEWEIERFRSVWGVETDQRRAFELLLNTAQRGSDVAPMVRTHYRNGVISVASQEKTGARVDVPASADLRFVLDPWLEKNPSAMLLLPGERGKGWSVDALRHVMGEAYEKAGLVGVTTHGLRFCGATRLHEIGCDWEAIGAITGHETAEMVRHYVRKKRLATIAIKKLDRATKREGSANSDGSKRKPTPSS